MSPSVFPVLSVLAVLAVLAVLSLKVISVDCMLNTDVIDLNPFYIKQIIFSLLPIVAMSAAGAVMSCAYCVRRYRKRGKEPMVLDAQQVTEKVHKRHESRKKEVKQLFKMVGVLSLYAHLILQLHFSCISLASFTFASLLCIFTLHLRWDRLPKWHKSVAAPMPKKRCEERLGSV